MSVEAITWALKQPVEKSSTKFVLVVLANCASAATAIAFPSIAYVCEATAQNRKTVIAAMQRLTLAGFIVDSGQRYGNTKQIIGYRLRMDSQRDGDLLTERHYCYRSEDAISGQYYIGVRSCLGEPTGDASYIGSGRWIQRCRGNGAETIKTVLSVFTSRIAAEEAERDLIASAIGDPLCMNLVVPPKRTESGTVSNSTENGTGQRVPKRAGKSPDLSAKQSQKRATETSLTVSKQDQQQGLAPQTLKPTATPPLPGWVPVEAWANWHAFRNSRKGWTAHARQLSLRTLTSLRDAGHDPTGVIEQSIEHGWTGLHPVRGHNLGASNANPSKLSAAERVLAHAIEGERADRERDTAGAYRCTDLVGSHG